MKIKLNLILIVALFCLTFASANAQTTAPDIAPTHLQAAENLLMATGINKQFGTITDNIIAAFGNNMPQDKKAAFAGVMKKFMNKYYNWDIVKGRLSKIYVAEFSEAELKQLTDFYNTPVGIKYGEKQAILNQKGMAMGQQIVMEHQAELQEMMQEAFKAQ